MLVAVPVLEPDRLGRGPVGIEEGAVAESRRVAEIVEAEGEGRLLRRPIFDEGGDIGIAAVRLVDLVLAEKEGRAVVIEARAPGEPAEVLAKARVGVEQGIA